MMTTSSLYPKGGVTMMMLLLLVVACEGFSPVPSGMRTMTTTRPPTATTTATTTTRRTTKLRASQVLEFIEPTTGVKVKLVGAMHYNPASIQLAADTINDAARNDELGSVLIESCAIRWNNTNEMSPFLSSILTSEMRTAHDLAMEYGRPVVLGDQLINVTGHRLSKGLKETVQDLVLYPVTGWKSIAANITQARKQAAPIGSDYLGLFSFFEPKLLLAAPVSLIKYPLSYLIKSPMASIAVFSLLFWADSSSAATTTSALLSEEPITATDIVVNLLGSGLEILLFARIFLKELLAERNDVLARNILDQCRYYQSQPAWKGWLENLGRASAAQTTTTYAEGSVRPQYSESEKCVIAVLGLAHCNGIAKLLQEQRVS